MDYEDYEGAPNFPATVRLPTDNATLDATTHNAAIEGLADRTAFLRGAMVDGDSALAGVVDTLKTTLASRLFMAQLAYVSTAVDIDVSNANPTIPVPVTPIVSLIINTGDVVTLDAILWAGPTNSGAGGGNVALGSRSAYGAPPTGTWGAYDDYSDIYDFQDPSTRPNHPRILMATSRFSTNAPWFHEFALVARPTGAMQGITVFRGSALRVTHWRANVAL